MGIYKNSEILAYSIGDGVVCPKCITEQELTDLKESQILGENDFDEDETVFCDRNGDHRVYG